MGSRQASCTDRDGALIRKQLDKPDRHNVAAGMDDDVCYFAIKLLNQLLLAFAVGPLSAHCTKSEVLLLRHPAFRVQDRKDPRAGK